MTRERVRAKTSGSPHPDRFVPPYSRRIETAVAKLHAVVKRGQFAAVPPVKDAITALDIELNRLAHISTWPWNPGTLRGVIAAVFLPVVIWLVQYGLQRVLG